MLIGVDDMDLFKGIELKLAAMERVLDYHPEWRGRLVLVQVTNAPRCAPCCGSTAHGLCSVIGIRLHVFIMQCCRQLCPRLGHTILFVSLWCWHAI